MGSSDGRKHRIDSFAGVATGGQKLSEAVCLLVLWSEPASSVGVTLTCGLHFSMTSQSAPKLKRCQIIVC